MPAKILDGKKLATEMRANIAAQVATLKATHNITPRLAVILIGDDPASHSYVTAKEKACHETGIHSHTLRLPPDTTQDQLLTHITTLNNDPTTHGILIQLPLPKHINESTIINAINPDKDVDGFTPVNIGRMIIGDPCYLPCTPHGIIQMLLNANIDTTGKHAVVIGRSNIVGKPIAHLLMRKAPGGNATVTVCHTATPDLPAHTRQADIIIAAAGRPNTLTGDMIKPGAVIIDVGVNRIPDPTAKTGHRLVGDVDYATAAPLASHITPVPGGVGPMTITMLLHNTLESAKRTLQ